MANLSRSIQEILSLGRRDRRIFFAPNLRASEVVVVDVGSNVCVCASPYNTILNEVEIVDVD